jgi:hypothetical protein
LRARQYLALAAAGLTAGLAGSGYPVFDASWQETEHDVATEAYQSPSPSPDDRVIGVSHNGEAVAYPRDQVRWNGPINPTTTVYDGD